jgi:uncharacterized membrane protein YfcA
MLPAPTLQLIIGGFALWVSWRMFKGHAAQQHGVECLPSIPAQVGAGGVIGVASAIFGIGGGSLTVPYLSRYGVPMQQAVASSACGLPIAVAGALGFALFGANMSHLPAGSVGFVHVPAFIGISCASLLTARWGARLAHQLPAHLLRRLFSILLLLVGLVFIVKSQCDAGYSEPLIGQSSTTHEWSYLNCLFV